MPTPASRVTEVHPVSYSSLRRDADTIEVIVEAALDYIENDEPVRTPLVNLRSAVHHLRDAINTAEGQIR